MAGRKGGLGRGLDALIPVDRPEHGFANLPLDRVSPNPQQPRAHFDQDALESLAASIREVGVLQPIVVRPEDEHGRYLLVAGERRCRAAREAGLTEIPAVIRDEAEESTNLTEALIENVQREDLTALEEAAAYRELMDDFGLTHDQIATRVGKSRSAVTNTLRLLQLPAPIQGLLENGRLSAGHARAFLALEDEAAAIRLALKAADEGWSVRQVEDAVKLKREEQAPRPARVDAAVRPAAMIELEQRLADQLGTRVKIDFSGKKGRLVIGFSSLDDLERIYRAFYH